MSAPHQDHLCDREDCPEPIVYRDEWHRVLCDNHLTEALERQGGAYAGCDHA